MYIFVCKTDLPSLLGLFMKKCCSDGFVIRLRWVLGFVIRFCRVSKAYTKCHSHNDTEGTQFKRLSSGLAGALRCVIL